MRPNLSMTDRLIRMLMVAALTVLVITQTVTGTLAVIALIIAGIVLVTGFVGFCPIYALFRISSKKRQISNKQIKPASTSE